jgi:hypothetical protein
MDRRESEVPQQTMDTHPKRKRAYSKPRVTDHGQLAALTLAGGQARRDARTTYRNS